MKPDWDKERELQATREYLQHKTNREIENLIKALRERDPLFDTLCQEADKRRGR